MSLPTAISVTAPDAAEPIVDPDDIPEAQAPAEPEAPEVPTGMERVAAWDEPPDATGLRIEPVPPEDEEATSDLVNEGLEEAERELRLAANTESEDEPADPDASADYPTTGILS